MARSGEAVMTVFQTVRTFRKIKTLAVDARPSTWLRMRALAASVFGLQARKVAKESGEKSWQR
jgi:hypothetical protein